jgi:predicted ribosome quality control (RQC) complex YloA/Tae2 family protein
VEELLTTIMNARKEGIQWKEIEEKLAIGKEKGIKSAKILEKLNPKSKQIWVKLFNDNSQEEEIIELDFTKTITENANAFYEKSKKARRKIPGAEAAIGRSKKLISEIQEKKEDIEKEIEAKPLVVKRVKRWYEKFHWFLCGESVIIGGTDAKTNERILKTYLDDTDIFFHADVHGAPFVVAKEGQTRLSEECIVEVAIFALTYSSLWKDKKLVGDVYHVLPDQVSLTPPSGQYIPKGGVMIYGEKNYSKNVEINHAVGIIFYEQHAQFIGGPLESVSERTNLYFMLKPGQIPKGKIAKELMVKFQEKCPDEHKHKLEALTVNELLPFIPGDSDIII